MNGTVMVRAWGHELGSEKSYLSEPFDISEFVTFNEIAQGKLYPFVGDSTFLRGSGFEDKKGVEIYEGYIVEFSLAGEKCRGVVRYDAKSARFVKDILTSYGRERKDLSSYASSQVVIGNVLDNPELAEGIL